MKRPAWAGTESRVRWETTTIVRKDAGTDQAAGWPRSADVQPEDGDVAIFQIAARSASGTMNDPDFAPAADCPAGAANG